jgi:hypothetical protein
LILGKMKFYFTYTLRAFNRSIITFFMANHSHCVFRYPLGLLGQQI